MCELDIAAILPYFNVNMQLSQQLKRMINLRRASLRQRIVAAAVLVGIAGLFGFLRLAGAGRIDTTVLFGLCGFRQRYNLPCPTCGMTTAAAAFAGGRILRAFYIQPAAAFICLILCVAAFLAFFTTFSGLYFSFIERLFTEIKMKYIILFIVVVICTGWIATLLRELAAGGWK